MDTIFFFLRPLTHLPCCPSPQLYGNEADVGRAVRDSGVPREEVWVTSKFWPDYRSEHLFPEARSQKYPPGYLAARAAAEETLQRLGLAPRD
mgnify:CR=1 FL=1